MPKRPNRIPPRIWFGQDKMRAAYHAGGGASAAEIAQVIGGVDAGRVRAMLKDCGLPLLRRSSGEHAFVLKWKQRDYEALTEIANELDRDPAELAALIIRKVLAEGPERVRGLVHEFDIV